MSTKNGMGNDNGLLRVDVEDIVARQPRYRIEIAPQKIRKAGCRYAPPYPVSISEIYTDAVPKIESEMGPNVEVSVGRSTWNKYAWVVCVTPTKQSEDREKQTAYAAVEKIKKFYPEWSSSISVVERTGG